MTSKKKTSPKNVRDDVRSVPVDDASSVQPAKEEDWRDAFEPPKKKRVKRDDTRPAKRQAKQRTAGRREAKESPAREKRGASFYDEGRTLHKVLPFVLFFLALALGVCLVIDLISPEKSGLLGQWLRRGPGALFAGGIYLFPVLLVLHGCFWHHDVRRHCIFARIAFSLWILCDFSALLAVAYNRRSTAAPDGRQLIELGRQIIGGGWIGGWIGYGMTRLVGLVCTWIIVLLCLILYILSYIDLKALFGKMKDNYRIKKAKKALSPKEKKPAKEPKERRPRFSFAARRRMQREMKRNKDTYFRAGKDEESFAAIKARMEKDEKRHKHKYGAGTSKGGTIEPITPTDSKSASEAAVGFSDRENTDVSTAPGEARDARDTSGFVPRATPYISKASDLTGRSDREAPASAERKMETPSDIAAAISAAAGDSGRMPPQRQTQVPQRKVRVSDYASFGTERTNETRADAYPSSFGDAGERGAYTPQSGRAGAANYGSTTRPQNASVSSASDDGEGFRRPAFGPATDTSAQPTGARPEPQNGYAYQPPVHDFGTSRPSPVTAGSNLRTMDNGPTPVSDSYLHPVNENAQPDRSSYADSPFHPRTVSPNGNYYTEREVLSATPEQTPGTYTEESYSKVPERVPIRTYEVTKSVREPERPVNPYAGNAYRYPSVNLLRQGQMSVIDESVEEEIARNSEILIDTLESFHVSTHMVGTSRGPRITRYEIMPDKGVKIASIVGRIDDISLNLASAGIRIEAPIPGMSAVGVEVPNRKPSLVRIRDLLTSDEFVNATSTTTICLGADVTGRPVFADVAKMPHLLIAGATGMGKSVCINTILLSLLYKARPDEVKLILVDPKKVELGVYNNIPHLLVPVVTDPQAAAGALIWAVGEMERRFELIEAMGVRDIKGYNAAVSKSPDKGTPLPKIVIVIDELNDLMMSARDAVEASICRIAQKARAAGMHLIIGTQRPSVDVITGLIKANIPSRIAFHVTSMVDSRTILDTTGAEKLLDKGDMLAALVGQPEPKRVQGSMVEDEEVEKVTTFLKENAALLGDSVYDREVMESIQHETEKYKQSNSKRGASDEEDDEPIDEDIWDDSKFRQAVELAVNSGKISTSLIQRKLSLGYGKAAKYIDAMEGLAAGEKVVTRGTHKVIPGMPVKVLE